MSTDSKTLEERSAELWQKIARIEFGNHGRGHDQRDEAITAAILAFAQSVAAESAPRWIPVGERLPEDYEPALLWHRDRHTFLIGHIITDGPRPSEHQRYWKADGDLYGIYPESCYFTHWQPLRSHPHIVA